MAATKTATIQRNARLWVALTLTLFLMLNGVLVVLTLGAVLRDVPLPVLLSDESSPAMRLLLFVGGLAVSWLIAGMLYRRVIEAWEPISTGVQVAFVLFFYILLTFFALAFLGAFGWLWMPAVFVVLLIATLLIIPRYLGAVLTTVAFAGVVGVCVVTWLLTAA